MRQHRNHLLGIWFGLFAMLMIHIGPLISATQVLLLDANTVFIESTPDSAMHHESAHTHAHDTAEHAQYSVDYHALMGHHSAPRGAPQWLAKLDMCGYCDLLTISPPLVLVLLFLLPLAPPVQWLTALPARPKFRSATHRLRYPRAPPIYLFT